MIEGSRYVRTSQKLNVIARQALCESCNSEWLAGLETPFKQLMGPAMLATGVVELDCTQQEMVALWSVKTGLLLELAARRDRAAEIPLPASVFRWLHLRKAPPPNASVWIGVVEPPLSAEPTRYHGFSNQMVGPAKEPLPPSPPHDPIGNVVTYFIGHLLVKVVVLDLPEQAPPIASFDPQETPHLVQIWPVTHGTVHWPPRSAVSYDLFAMPGFLCWPMPAPKKAATWTRTPKAKGWQ